jgi:imidazolonepropionase-like amidohydrolase
LPVAIEPSGSSRYSPEALVAVTSASAEYLDEPLGAIATGNYADHVVVDGDPLARIEDAAKVDNVI